MLNSCYRAYVVACLAFGRVVLFFHLFWFLSLAERQKPKQIIESTLLPQARGTSMYYPTTRVLTILELLQARPGLSGADLAARLEVDRRTVRRYITMLQDLGIPIEAIRGPLGGYRIRPGFKLPPLMLADEEALAIT